MERQAIGIPTASSSFFSAIETPQTGVKKLRKGQELGRKDTGRRRLRPSTPLSLQVIGSCDTSMSSICSY